MKDRTKLLGSSEIAAAIGLSRWKTMLELWAEKTGKVDPPDLSDIEAVEWGTRLEEPVARKFADKHDVKLMAYKKRFTHPEHSFISCELDRIITKTDIIVEVKTCNAYKAKEWSDEDYPLEYELQVQLAMGLSGRKKAWMCCLIGGQKYVEKYLEFDEEIYQMMIEKGVAFWDMVQKDIVPAAVYGDKDILAKLFPGNAEYDTIELELSSDDDCRITSFLGSIAAMKDEIKYCEKTQEESENDLKQFMGDTEVLIMPDGQKITWKSQTRKGIDQKKLKAEKPELYEKYLKESITRVMRIGKKPIEKENENGG